MKAKLASVAVVLLSATAFAQKPSIGTNAPNVNPTVLKVGGTAPHPTAGFNVGDIAKSASGKTIPIVMMAPQPLAFRFTPGANEVSAGMSARMTVWSPSVIFYSAGGAHAQMTKTSSSGSSLAAAMAAASAGTSSTPPPSSVTLLFTPENTTQRYRITCAVDSGKTYNVSIYAQVESSSVTLSTGTQYSPSGNLSFEYEPMSPKPSYVAFLLSAAVDWSFSGCEGTRITGS